jgi:hypothetical protein
MSDTAHTDIGLLSNPSVLEGLYHPQRHFSANPSLARRVYAASDGDICLVPADGQFASPQLSVKRAW